MSGNEEQAAGSAGPDEYEAGVLDVLDKEMASVQSAPKAKEQPDEEVDALVSDLLKQMMAEPDQPQTGDKANSEEIGGLRLECMSPEKEAPSSEIKEVLSDPEPEPVRFENRDAMLAEFMALQEKTSASENSPSSLSSEPGFSKLEDSEQLLAEFIASQEAIFSAEGKNVPHDSGSEPGQFEKMDTVLAEYMTPVEETPSAETNIVPPHPQSESKKPEGLDTRPADLISTQEKTSPPEDKEIPFLPNPVPQEAENPDRTESIERPEVKSSAIAEFPEEKTPSSEAPSETAASKSAAPVSAAKGAPKSKTLLIAAACFCVLAVVAVPGHYFSGPSGKSSKPAKLQPAFAARQPSGVSKAMPNPEAPAVLISQVSPKYPELAIKNRASASVVLDLSIDSNGKVVKATPVSGPRLFHSEAVRAAMKWRYKPASIAGSNVPSRSRATFNFSLKN